MVEPRLDSSDNPADAFRRAVEELGGQSATARVIGVSQQAVSAKLAAGKPCSAKWARPLSDNTSLSLHELRPDLWPREPVKPAEGTMEPVR